ncbi:hypothetical protein [Massilia pseudoviolaceinigra]|uniref:hypothetical protein n=1 Tax=Massilia pseudoviolaceinigra TaxID=3057165 RepID=UPI002796AB35|nr:hypothetical protein [Massilia sp. CCM 9206]MDQ1922183.1 hypothetical protein [Massilia sp. CCM 9206]
MPSLAAIKKIAQVLRVTTDFLIFEESALAPDADLALQFQAIASMSEPQQAVTGFSKMALIKEFSVIEDSVTPGLNFFILIPGRRAAKISISAILFYPTIAQQLLHQVRRELLSISNVQYLLVQRSTILERIPTYAQMIGNWSTTPSNYRGPYI